MTKKIIRQLILVAVALIAIVDGYLVFFKNTKQESSTASISTSSESSSASSSSSTSSSSNTSTSSSSASSSSMADGTYTGASTETEWGPVQVQITVSSGKITNIDVLSYPDSEQKSVRINEQALPTYKQEALEAQSSNIDQISGATETYKGFTGSLQDAITQAEAAA